MSLEQLKASLPEYAKDLKLNLGSVMTTSDLSEQQIWGAALASAIASRNTAVTATIEGETRGRLSETALRAAKAAAAIMGMNNVYYRFTHLASNKEYRSMPARLRMNALANPGVEKLDFELWSLAVSAVNGCGMCIEAHGREVLAKGASKQAVQDVVRVASVIHAVAVTLEAEDAFSAEQKAAAAA